METPMCHWSHKRVHFVILICYPNQRFPPLFFIIGLVIYARRFTQNVVVLTLFKLILTLQIKNLSLFVTNVAERYFLTIGRWLLLKSVQSVGNIMRILRKKGIVYLLIAQIVRTIIIVPFVRNCIQIPHMENLVRIVLGL